jgi:hypothetical protein
MKQFCENIKYQNLHVKLFIRIFYHFKFYLKHILKTGSICSQVPKCCPHQLLRSFIVGEKKENVAFEEIFC